MSGEKKDSGFTLQLTNDSFSLRCKDAFSSLDALEKKHQAYERSQESSRRRDQSLLMNEDPVEDWNSDRSRDKTNQRQWGRRQETRPERTESWKMRYDRHKNRRDNDGFRQPFRRPPRRPHHTVPDFKKNPGKWTCYSLEDVKNSDMSEKSNQRAAFEFLAERRRVREAECVQEKFEVGGTACSKGILSFSKPKSSAGIVSSKKEAKVDSQSVSEEIHINGKQSAVEKTLCFEEETDMQSVVSEAKGQLTDICSENSSGNVVSSFKTRKSVRRNIRNKESDETDD